MKTINFKGNENVVRNENIERYRVEMAKYKPLEAKETISLIILAQSGDEKARERVINANLRIVWSIAKHYNGMDKFEDILQNGNIGLIKAVETFDVSRETLFSTWALEYVRKYITIGLTNESRIVRMGAHLVNGKSYYNATSFDAPISEEDGEKKTLHDVFASDAHTDNFSEVESMRYKLNCLMNCLDEREKTIVCGLFGFGTKEVSPYTLSKKFGITEERVRQIKLSALEKMKEMA